MTAVIKDERIESADLPIDAEKKRLIDQDIERQAPVHLHTKRPILEVVDLKMHFPVTKGLLKRKIGSVKAVDGVSFVIRKGETFGIVGESGSGKSTVGNCVMRNLAVTSGTILFDGQDISQVKGHELHDLRKRMTIITQDPYASLDPRMTIRDAILEGVQIHGLIKGRKEQFDLVDRMMTMVGLNPSFADRYPHEFSGGQRQRISIARALAINPAFIVCDEIVSALDVSIQSQIIALMMKLQAELGLTYIFIGHDLSVVRHLSNNIAVMYLGKIMELTNSDELYDRPLHPYTQALISAAPIPKPRVDRTRERILLHGEIPSPINPPIGCNFNTRCPYAFDRCFKEDPEIIDVGNNHLVACHKVTRKEQGV